MCVGGGYVVLAEFLELYGHDSELAKHALASAANAQRAKETGAGGAQFGVAGAEWKAHEERAAVNEVVKGRVKEEIVDGKVVSKATTTSSRSFRNSEGPRGLGSLSSGLPATKRQVSSSAFGKPVG